MKQGSGLRNKRVVILGGSSGIGFAVAQLAASQGTTVVIASSNAERVQKAIGSLAGHAQGHTVDLSDERSIEKLLGASVRSITWYSPLAIASTWRTLPIQILNRPDERSSCAIGLRWLLLHTQARVFASVAPLCSLPELPGTARIKDGLLPRVSAEHSRP